MCDDDRISFPSLSEGSDSPDRTRPSDVYPSPPQESNGEICVCNLSIKFLLEQGRWVGNAQNLYKPVGQCNSFHEEVKNDSFPFLLGGKYVEVGEISGDEDIEDEGVNLEYSAENKNVQCLACAEDGKCTNVYMYQSVLHYEAAKDGYTRPRLAWFIDLYEQSRKYCCVLWRTDGKGKAEDGAVFGIWGAGGPHERLNFRVAAKRKSSVRNEFHCLQNKTTGQLIQFLKDNGVYMASKKEAERALRQQLEAFGKPQWDTYARWKFPEGISSSTDSLDACCMACYNPPPSRELRCEGTFRLQKLVLKPVQNKEYRILAYRIDAQAPSARFIFFSKRRDDDTLRFLKTDGTYTELVLRLLRNGQSFNGPAITQYGGPHKPHSNSDTARQKRTHRNADLADQPSPKRAHTNTIGFNPINQPQSNERVCELLGGTETHPGAGEQSETPSKATSVSHKTGSLVSQDHLEGLVGPKQKKPSNDDQPGHGPDDSTSRCHIEEQTALTSRIPTIIDIEKERLRNKQLKAIKVRKQEELSEIEMRLKEKEHKRIREELECEYRRAQNEEAEIAQLDAQIETLRQRLRADASGETIQTVLESEEQRLQELHKSFRLPDDRSIICSFST